MGGQGEADRVLIARGFWDDVAIGEPLGDLERTGKTPTATGQGKRLDRQLAALRGDLESASGAIAHAAGKGQSANQLAMA